MSDLFQKTIAHLPEILARNASTMMQRMVAAMQQAISADPGFDNASYFTLLLKMGTGDLVREFDVAVRQSMAALKRDLDKSQFTAVGLSLAIEPLELADARAEADFQSSTAAFRALCARAAGLGESGIHAYNKDVLLGAVQEAFAKSRLGAAEAARMLPYARRALNDELHRLYARLEAL